MGVQGEEIENQTRLSIVYVLSDGLSEATNCVVLGSRIPDAFA